MTAPGFLGRGQSRAKALFESGVLPAGCGVLRLYGLKFTDVGDRAAVKAFLELTQAIFDLGKFLFHLGVFNAGFKLPNA